MTPIPTCPSRAGSPEFVRYVEEAVRLHQAGQLDLAEAMYRKARAVAPADAWLANLAGALLFQKGDLVAADAALRRALAIDARQAPFWFNLAKVQRARQQNALAEQSYRKAIALDPKHLPAIDNLANLLTELRRWEEAVPYYRTSLSLNPHAPASHRSLAWSLNFMGDLTAAEQALDHGMAVTQAPALLVRKALLVPTIAESSQQINQCRERILPQLDALERLNISIGDPAREVGSAQFYLAYHGKNNRTIQSGIADFFMRRTPLLRQIAPHCERWSAPAEKIRVGFVSAFLRQHTVGRFMEGMIAALPATVFEVHVFHVKAPPEGDAIAAAIHRSAHSVTVLSDQFPAAQQQLSEARMDLLVYPEIGMDPFTYFLAFARLAPVQAAFYGHPDTTGIGNIDYFISHQGCEPANAADHYREKLVCIPSDATYTYFKKNTALIEQSKNITVDLPSGTRYFCPQTLMKIHPDFDATLTKILREDPKATILLAEGEEPVWKKALARRLAKTLGDDCSRVVFLPLMSLAQYLATLRAVDVVLDLPYFSGGGSSFDAIAAQAPVAVWEGEFMRGRQTATLYRQMGIEGCIAHSERDYVRIAIDLANDRSLHDHLKDQLGQRGDAVFEDARAQRAFARILEQVATTHR